MWIDEVTPDAAAVAAFAALPSAADRAVLAVGQSRGVDNVLSNDEELRRRAAAAGLTCLRTPEVLVLMKHRGVVSAVRPVLDQMRAQGYGIAAVYHRQAVLAAGETP